jgi:SAM-dependent methyltransferase
VSDGVAVVTGNPVRLHGTRNPIGRLLLRRFESDVGALLDRAAPASILDVGCGEGVLTLRFAERLPNGRIVGLDLDDPRLRAEWELRRRPNLEYRVGDASALPFATGEFELVSAIEVLEHLGDPVAALREITRVSSRHLLLSVPREPLFRLLNLLRGAYWSARGDSPGHLNHWSRRAFLDLVANQGRVEAVRSPLPWTIALVAVHGHVDAPSE